MSADPQRTAQELADARKRISARPRRYSEDVNECVAFAAGFEEGVRAALASQAEPVARCDGSTTEEGARAQADAHLRALLRYTENFYGAAIQHGMKAGETANAIAHIERSGKALHQLVHAWADVAQSRTTPPAPAPAQAEQSEDGMDAEHARFYRWLRDNCATYTSPKAPIQLIVQEHADVHRTHGAAGYRKGLDDAIRAAIAAKEKP